MVARAAPAFAGATSVGAGAANSCGDFGYCGVGLVVEVSELVAGDFEGVGGLVHAIVESGAFGGDEEFSDDGAEGIDSDVAWVVGCGASPESVDPGSVVELVWHWSAPRSWKWTFVLRVARLGWQWVM